MSRYPNSKTGLFDDRDDPFRHCSGRFPHQRRWTLADDYALGKSYFTFSIGAGGVYHPKGRSVTLKSDIDGTDQ